MGVWVCAGVCVCGGYMCIYVRVCMGACVCVYMCVACVCVVGLCVCVYVHVCFPLALIEKLERGSFYMWCPNYMHTALEKQEIRPRSQFVHPEPGFYCLPNRECASPHLTNEMK